MLYDSSTEEEILSGHPDFVLDCIDNIDTKVSSKFNSLFDYICSLSSTITLTQIYGSYNCKFEFSFA